MPDYFDIHSHLNISDFNSDREEVLARMKEKKVWTIVVGDNLESSKNAVEMAKKNDGVFACVGVHPALASEASAEEAGKAEGFDEKIYGKLAENKKMVAVGECGLDYFRIKNQESRIKVRQKEMFEKQIDFAIKHGKSLMIHCRPSKGSMDAYEEAFEILKSSGAPEKIRGNAHFFAGDMEIAKKFLSIGFTLSFTGVITFARDYDEVIKYAPLDMILSETDSPFVAPAPFRGKRCEPTYVIEVVKKIAEIRNEPLEKVKKAMVKNAMRLFNIKA